LDRIDLRPKFSYSVELGANAINEETKTVSFILSDESIVGRGWYDMKLLHGENNVNFERSSILKVFFNHDSRSLPIGKWTNLRLEDKKLKADAIFDSNDEFAMKIFNKIKDGFLESISVGVEFEKYDVKQRDKQNDLIIVKRWGVFEASVVNIPAIPNAKVGLEFEENNNKENSIMNIEELKAKHPNLYQEVFGLGVKSESERLKAIDKILKPELAHYFVDLKYDGKSTPEQIELAQYRKIDELSAKDREKLQKKKEEFDSDGVSLGNQTLEMNLNGDSESDKEKLKAKKEELELKEDSEAFFGGVV